MTFTTRTSSSRRWRGAWKRTAGGLRIEFLWQSLKQQHLNYINTVEVLDAEGVVLQWTSYRQDPARRAVGTEAFWHDVVEVSLRNLPGVKVDPAAVETNIVFFDIAGTGMTADPFVEAMKAKGVDLGGAGTSIRIVTHLDISRDDVMTDTAIGARRRSIASAICLQW